jgi:glutaconyl-CoA/methylmalonyl-CoA decarboxylase subunit gamma
MTYTLSIAEQTFEVDVADVKGNIAQVLVNGMPYTVHINHLEEPGPQQSTARPSQTAASSPVQRPRPAPKAAPAQASGGILAAPIPGLILQIKVNVGDKVTQGQIVAIMEAMKMENDLLAPISGTVKEIRLQKGSDVSTGDIIMVIA